MPDGFTLSPAPLPGQPHRVALLLGDKPVGHAVDEEVARLFIRGWVARLGLRRRLAPPSMLGRDRKAWLRGWDHANERQRRAVAA